MSREMAKKDANKKEMNSTSNAYCLYVPCWYQILVDRS